MILSGIMLPLHTQRFVYKILQTLNPMTLKILGLLGSELGLLFQYSFCFLLDLGFYFYLCIYLGS